MLEIDSYVFHTGNLLESFVEWPAPRTKRSPMLLDDHLVLLAQGRAKSDDEILVIDVACITQPIADGRLRRVAERNE